MLDEVGVVERVTIECQMVGVLQQIGHEDELFGQGSIFSANQDVDGDSLYSFHQWRHRSGFSIREVLERAG